MLGLLVRRPSAGAWQRWMRTWAPSSEQVRCFVESHGVEFHEPITTWAPSSSFNEPTNVLCVQYCTTVHCLCILPVSGRQALLHRMARTLCCCTLMISFDRLCCTAWGKHSQARGHPGPGLPSTCALQFAGGIPNSFNVLFPFPMLPCKFDT